METETGRDAAGARTPPAHPAAGARATCRLQLRGGLDFAAVVERIDYFEAMGFTHLYLSPIFTAAPGSTHGYDIVDPTEIDPALGGEAGFRTLCARVHAAGMGLLLDIVPNHVGMGSANPRWMDMLRNGAQASSAPWFDVDWQARAGGTPGKILLPILDRPWRHALADGAIVLDREAGVVRHHDHTLPLAPGSEQGALEEVLARQHWRLAHWPVGNRLLNWRRFFDITTLAGLRVHEPAVFEATHEKVLELLDEPAVHGLRIDHVDGLADPGGYLRRLDAAWRARRDDPPWIVVEKILAPHESLPDGWPVAGTTGYETLARITAVMTDGDGLVPMAALWRACGGGAQGFPEMLARAKREILENNLRAELERLTMRLVALPTLDDDPADVREALMRLAIATDCYRAYGDEQPGAFDRAFANADFDDLSSSLPDRLRASMPAGGWARTAFEQLTAPTMAKSLEDTVFYRYTPALVANEVGSDPGTAPPTAPVLHAGFADRNLTRPGALVATATHDTKRGEDARARLALITHAHAQWPSEFAVWMRLANRHRLAAEPDECTLNMLLQSLVGAWPEGGAAQVREPVFETRIERFIVKALREAKQRTSWLAPDETYERTVQDFMHALLQDDDFTARADAYLGAHRDGMQGFSLAQLALKLTLPGVADVYHGTERADLSFVDPDNRRPVDIDALRGGLRATAADWRSPLAKQALMRRLLHCRREMPGLFAAGRYLPALDERPEAPVFAFTRHAGNAALAVAVINRYQPVETRRAQLAGAFIPEPPDECGAGWRPVHDPDAGTTARIDLAEWLADAPVAVFVAGVDPLAGAGALR